MALGPDAPRPPGGRSAACAKGATPVFPPARADALLLGGTVFDLLAREEGDRACVTLARGPHPDGPIRALEIAFPRSVRHTESAWRSHLERLSAGPRSKNGHGDAAVNVTSTVSASVTASARIHAGWRSAGSRRPWLRSPSSSSAASSPAAGTMMSRGPAARKSGTSKPPERRASDGMPSSSSRPWTSSASAWLRTQAARTSGPSA